ncbi:MAG: DUF5522 domain-containing protein [Candidatus Nanopelagicales bacterium]|nr:DUF5522 domain-containing protein [Candidatus Nanopelagicales bacterium]
MNEPGQTTTDLADRPLSSPARSRLDPNRADYDAILAAHGEAMSLDRPGYLDPRSGLFVMTARYHADRGWCCNSGCRHCPFVAD